MTTLDREERGDMIMKGNILNHKVEIDASFLKMNTEDRTRGHTKTFKISLSQIDKNFFTYKITKKLNGLSQEIINSKAIDTFKRAYDQEQGLIGRSSTTSS